VAEITLGFWLAKIVATTLGEVAGDAIAQTLDLGYVAGLGITLSLLAAFLVVRLRADRYHPLFFWATVVGTTTAGTEIADLSTHTLHLGYVGTSALLFGGMLLTLGLRHLRRGTCWRTRSPTVRASCSSGWPCCSRTDWARRSVMGSSMWADCHIRRGPWPEWL